MRARLAALVLVAGLVSLPVSPAVASPGALDGPVSHAGVKLTEVVSEPVVAVTCVTGTRDRRVACIDTMRDPNGTTTYRLCMYTEWVSMVLPWYQASAPVCTDIGIGWSLVTAPSACDYHPDRDRPYVCVNGHDNCALWVTSIRFVCDRQVDG